MLDRERELQELDASLRGARSGQGSVTLLQGQPGLGKSTLLDAAAARARASGMRVLSARGLELERGFPFGLALRLFEPALNSVPQRGRDLLLAGPARPAADLFEGRTGGDAALGVDHGGAVVHGLRWLTLRLAVMTEGVPTTGLLLAVDDVHWSDGPSLRFLTHLAADLDRLPVAVVVAAREGEPDVPPEPLRRLGSQPGARHLHLQPLSAQAVHTMVRRQFPSAGTAFADAAARLSGGNPFYLKELLVAAREKGLTGAVEDVASIGRLLPDAVLGSVVLRLARLSADARALAFALSVLGDRTPLRRAAVLSGLTPEAAEQAADVLGAAGISREGDPLGFIHPLVATAVYQNVPPLARSRAHRRAADLMQQDGAAPELTAAHLLVCRPNADPCVVSVLRQAAECAAGNGDFTAAELYLERALAEPPDADTRRTLLPTVALTKAAVSSPQAAEDMAAALEASSDGRQRAQLLRALARLQFALSDFDGAADNLARGRRTIGDTDPLAAEMCVDELALSGFLPARQAEVARRLREMAPGAFDGGSLDGVPPLLLGQVAGALTADGAAAGAVRRAASAALAGEGGAGFYDLATGYAVLALLAIDDLALAAPPIERSLQRASETGSLVVLGFGTHWRAYLRYLRGDLLGAVSDAERNLDIWRAGWGICRHWVAPLLAKAQTDLGNFEAAEHALAIGADPPPAELPMLLEARARLALARDDPATALGDLLRAGALLEQQGQPIPPTLLPWRSQAALASLRLGDARAAVSLAGAELEMARSVGAPRTLGVALRVTGLVTGGPAGLRLLEDSVDVLSNSEAGLERARSLVELGGAEHRAGRTAASRESLRRGLDLAESSGAAPLVTRAAAELRRAGGRRRTARQQTGRAALTPTEARVAGLASQSWSTAQIAQTLYLSPKTVDWHLSNSYRKLDVHGRQELSAALHERLG